MCSLWLLYSLVLNTSLVLKSVSDVGFYSLHPIRYSLMSMNISNENDQANRAISNGKLHALLHFHTRPINVVVFHGSDREYSFSGGFPA